MYKRQLVDVSQDVIVREKDCGTTEGEWVSEIRDGNETIEPLADRILGRVAMEDVIHPETGEVLVPKDKLMDDSDVNKILKAGIQKVYILSLIHI